ncbi:MAG TPA: hypothetical protein PKO15_00725 [Fibrobacteria bacterium]|nr:hypothetical protein [Fibrobacteria bacterium]HOX51398.1 hypothetical protein [Fibrobacteria bacterium]
MKQVPGTFRPLLWIGGWASDLQCWDGLLASSYPGFDHRFIDSHAVLESTTRLERLVEDAPDGTCLVGWSLGALLVERLLREGKVPHRIAVLSVCPFLDFCAEEGPWRPLVLRRMIRRVQSDPLGTLEDFGTRMGLEGLHRQAWLAQAMELGEESLVRGLVALLSTRWPPPWAFHPRRLWAVSPDDQISPPCPCPAEATRRCPEGSGHVPFLRHPVAFGNILQELADL